MWAISDQFRSRLTGRVQEVRAKIEIMDTDLVPIRVLGGVGPDRSLIDATVDVDVSRGTRRTLVMSLLNADAEFSPTSDWGGLFYVNRVIRVYRGLVIGGAPGNEQIEYIPTGTFLVDKTETLVERGMSTVIIAGSDFWKKFTKAQFVQPVSFPKNTPINNIISYLASYAGVTKMSLDPLSSRTTLSKNIQAIKAFEVGDTAGDALKKIATDHGLDIFFDPLGVLISQDVRAPSDSAIVWRFTQEADEIAYLLRYVTDDDRLYNAVSVVGTANEAQIYRKVLTNNDPASPINVSRIGLRMYRMESGVLGSQEAVDKTAETLFHRHSLLSQSVAMEAITNPALEGNDVVEVVEPQYTGLTTTFRIETFSIPMFTSKQKIGMSRVVNLNPA